jgi:hypothetical protein
MCSGSIAVLEVYSIARHHNSKHKENYKNCAAAMRKEKVPE